MNSKRLEPCPNHPDAEMLYIDANPDKSEPGSEDLVPACANCKQPLQFKSKIS